MEANQLEVLPHKFTELRDLARAIRETQDELEVQRDDLMARANAVSLNLRIHGSNLHKAKSMLSRDDWEQWLSTHSPKTTPRFASYCIKVSQGEASQLDFWSECKMLVQPEQATKTVTEKPWPTSKNLATLKLFERWIDELESTPLNDCPESILTQYRNKLEPIVSALWPKP